MKISIAMIVKNEEKNIERTLKQLKELEKYVETEIVVVDTGSKDNTVELVKKYTDKIYFHQWNNNFSDMRNISIGYCSGEWILVVDADEVLYDVENLGKLFRSGKLDKYNAALIKIINFIEDAETSVNEGSISPLLRLFRKNTVEYKGAIHEQPDFKEPVCDSNIRFVHYGYNNDDFELMEHKFERNMELLKEELSKNPKDVYTNFQIAVSYSMHNELEEALTYIKNAYKYAGERIGEYIYVLDKYCFILYRLGEYANLVSKCNEGIKYEENFLDFYCYMGEGYRRLGENEKAIKSYEKYLELWINIKKGEIPTFTTLSINTRSYKDDVMIKLASCFYYNKNFEKAFSAIKRVSDSDLLKQSAVFILKVIVDGELWAEFKLINLLIDEFNYENVLCYFNDQVSLKNLDQLSCVELNEEIREMILIVKEFKKDKCLSLDSRSKILDILNRNNKLYSIYVYYLLRQDFQNEIEKLVLFGQNEIEEIFISLCSKKFDFNKVLIDGLSKLDAVSVNNIIIRTCIQKALLKSRKLPADTEKSIFLEYIAEKYYVLANTYSHKVISELMWTLPLEERFIFTLKEALSYKYTDELEYIRKLRGILKFNVPYISNVKSMIDSNYQYERHGEMLNMIPILVENVNNLINQEEYQQAYNVIDEALGIVGFDFDLMLLKYNFLQRFNYLKEADICLKDIILYGDSDRVNKLIVSEVN